MKENRYVKSNVSNSEKSANIVIIIFFLILAVPGCLFIAYPCVSYYRATNYSNNYTQSVDATIVDYDMKIKHSKKKSGSNTTYLYYPTYEFSIDDIIYRNQSKISYTQDYCTIGNVITVVYNPSNPNKNCIVTDIDAYKQQLNYAPVFIIIGILMIIGSIKIIR